MDFLSNLTKHDQKENSSEQQQTTNKTDHHATNKPDHQPATTDHSSYDPKPTNSELMSSCKIVADAAKSHFGNQQQPETKYDKKKVAAAAATILDAAADYGKLDHEKGVGKYVEQAEEYLRKYGGGSPTGGHHGGSGGNVEHHGGGVGAGEHHGGVGGGSGEHHGGGVPEKKGHVESGAGDYIKMAQGFLHKDDETGSGAGSTDFMKVAGDFLKK